MALVSLGVGVLTGCDDAELASSTDEREDPARSCVESWDQLSTGLEARHSLGVGRWVACAANPDSSVLPPAFDVTDFAVYPLFDSVDGYVRQQAISGDMTFNERADCLVMWIDGVRFEVRFRSAPRGMTLVDESRTYRFVQ